MKIDQLTAISPIDGRYLNQLSAFQPIFSESGLMRYRLLVEIRWLQILASHPKIKEISFDARAKQTLNKLVENFSEHDAEIIKSIEKNTRHDVKAIELFIKQKISKHAELKKIKEFIHFGCTSDDINNLAYALMIKEARDKYLLPQLKKISRSLEKFSHEFASIPMLARTHGQPATPTTLGKEFAVFTHRLNTQIEKLQKFEFKGKFNGATGNYNTHEFAYPHIPWESLCKQFVEQLDLSFNPYTTQIESHDYLAELFHLLIRIHNILINFSRDMWFYISFNYFSQPVNSKQVGSSTMPHKINPIGFENAEGNLSLSNALLDFFANKLPITRLQRDLTDSTILRNIGVACSHAFLAYQTLQKEIKSLKPNKILLKMELEQHWELLAEPLQTLMRRYGIENAYDQLKKISRGKKINKIILHQFINQLPLPAAEKKRFKKLTPSNYLGAAIRLAKKVK